MNRTDLPSAVRRWLRLPLWWGLGAVLLATTLLFSDSNASRSDRRTFDDGYRTSGLVIATKEGTREVDVSYRHPDTGEEVRTPVRVWAVELPRPGPDPVPIEVSRTDPEDAILAGDRAPATVNLANYAAWVVLPFLVWAVRRFTVWRTSQLMSTADTMYAMSATASPPSWWGRRWRLHLYPLDSGAAAEPVCTVLIVAPPHQRATFKVEVKGSPRPYGRVVARSVEDDTVIWPSGRALRSGHRPDGGIASVGPERQTKVGNWIAAVGGVLLFAGSAAMPSTDVDSMEVQDRSRPVTASVIASRSRPSDERFDVEVAYEWSKERRTGTVVEPVPVDEGARFRVRVDPTRPDRIWSPTDDTPPGTDEGNLGVIAVMLGFLLAIAGGMLRFMSRRRARDQRPPAPAGD